MKLILTSDLHQWIPKWEELVAVVRQEQPRFVLVAGDLLPKHRGHSPQKEFLGPLAGYFRQMKEAGTVTPIVYLGNDDHHILEPRLDELAAAGLCVNLNGKVHREAGLVFCGMNKVRDYPFGYKHWCARDGEYIACPIQFCGEGLTLDDAGEIVALPNLVEYLNSKPSIADELEGVVRQLQPGEMGRSIWMIHQPPSGLGMDICGNGQAVGSPTVLRFIEQHQPLLGCSGHIHESPHQPGGQWWGTVGRTSWCQPGQLGHHLYWVRVEIDAGPAVRSAAHSIFGPH